MPGQADLVRGWLEKARRDLVTAEREVEREGAFTDIVCYHAQQAAEKYLKALLTARGIVPPRTHALEDLLLLVMQAFPEAHAFAGNLSLLTPYAVAVRYPELAEPSQEEALEAVRLARRLAAWSDGVLAAGR